jgi:septal ring factor EnvC (AmiA/AmiB activator)
VDTEDGTHIDDEMMCRIMELPAIIVGVCPPETSALITRRQVGIEARKTDIENRNKNYYLDQCEKLDAYSEDLKEGLQRELKAIKKEISDKKKEARTQKDVMTLDQLVELQGEINRLDTRRKVMQRDLYNREDEIDRQRDALQEEIRLRLEGEITVETVMTFAFEIV